MTEICSIIHKCTIHGEKNYMNLDFSSPLREGLFSFDLADASNTILSLVDSADSDDRLVWVVELSSHWV